MAQKFGPNYQSLRKERREIRLLTIGPADSSAASDVLVCDLDVVSLDQDPQYEALSYTWGSRANPATIHLAGKAILVTKNLFAALSTLRRSEDVHIVWADAICINQDDPDERTDQVNIMGDIYRSASRVDVWLGDNKDGMAPLILSHGKDRSTHFSEITKSWWNRVWRTQEAVFAKELVFYLGNRQLSLEDLRPFVVALEVHIITDKACCPSVSRGLDTAETYAGFRNAVFDLGRRRQNIDENNFDLLDLLDAYRLREASDLRDKVFAFTSMACNVPDGFVNYRLPLRDCLVHCAKNLILGTHSLNVLRCVYSGAETERSKELALEYMQQGLRMPMVRLPGLPSWCPDWSQETSKIYWRVHNQTVYRELSTKFSAASGVPANVCFVSQNCLRTTGLICNITQEMEARCSPYFGPFPKDDLTRWRLLTSTFVDIFLDRSGCGEVVWGPYYKCQECIDVQYCCNCIRRADRDHPKHSFAASNEAQGHSETGPAQRRALGPGELVEFEGDLYEQRRAVPSDPVHAAEVGDVFVLEEPWWLRLRSVPYRFGDQETVREAFPKTLTADKHLQDYINTTNLARVHDFTKIEVEPSVMNKALFAGFWHDEVEVNPDIQRTSAASEKTDESRAVGSLVQTIVDRKNFFISKEGYIGLGPIDIGVGDMICVLKGGSVPFILRRTSTSTKDKTETGLTDCTLVGEAYVHGLMYGEALHLEQEGLLEESQFPIH